MVRGRTGFSWLLALTSVAALVVGTAADQGGGVSRAVVTPDDPVFAAQDQTPPEQDQQAPAAVFGRGGRGARGQPQPYNQVITSDAKTQDGVFKVHRIRDTIYYEIPRAELGKDFLWVTTLKRTTLGAGYGGEEVDEHVVRWEQSGNRVFLKLVNYDIVADPSKPIAQAVADANNPAIIRALDVAAVSSIGNLVVDVTSLFTSDVPELSARQSLGARGMDPQRTYIEKVVAFPMNINVEVTQTYTSAGDSGGGGRGRAAIRGNSGTVVLFHSMVKLPEQPMAPRLEDDRVGYFSTSNLDFGREENKAVERDYILRWRLEKKNPAAALSDPVEPIVYYIDPATPTKYVSWIKKGVEDWQPAFEAAGFTHAIVATDAPSKSEDPDWDPEDVRYSVIRWLPSTIENSEGLNIHDPRSGEILDGDIQLDHNIQNLLSMWYFTQVSPLVDPRVATFPLPDDLVGRLLEFVVAHEVGHTLGLGHNMKASSLYTIEQIRDKDWVKENSHTPSIMDYARFNYVAQPEDGIPAEDLVPKVGPYDKFAIMWGYKPIATAATPDAEKPTLDQWAHEQDTTPYLRFTTSNSVGADPGEEEEAVGDIDATRATALGIKNLKRIADGLVTATSRPGESYDDLAETYDRLVAQWRLEMGHVANVVGGVDSRELYAGQTGVKFTPVLRAKQAAAVTFLLDNAFKTPAFLTKPEILRRIEPTGIVRRIRTADTSILNELLQSSRLDRLIESSALDPAAYSPVQFLSDLRAGIWSDLRTPAAPIDVYRRNVQRAYLDTIDNRLNGGTAPSDEVRALLKGELRAVDQQVQAALPATTDVATRRHLQDVHEMITASLDPRAMRTRPAAGFGGRGGLVVSDTEDGDQSDVLSGDTYDFDNDPFLNPSPSWLADFRIK